MVEIESRPMSNNEIKCQSFVRCRSMCRHGRVASPSDEDAFGPVWP